MICPELDLWKGRAEKLGRKFLAMRDKWQKAYDQQAKDFKIINDRKWERQLKQRARLR